ncbi:hypothetical protein I317_05414 [Kwoniella heveanensis CBS 569]|nr:hypothetical protein I317_05414 [Kwoniella heveanensis CBS 569]
MPVRLSFSIVCEGGSDMLGPKSKGNVHIRGPRTDRKEHDSYIWVESVQPTKGPNGLTETFTTEDWNRALSSAQAPERKRFLSLKDLQASLSLGTPHKLKPMFCSAHGFSLLSQAGNEGSFPGRCQPRNAYTTRLKEFDYPQELVSTEGYKQAGLKARLSRQGHTLTCGQSPGSMILSANMCTEIRLIAARPHDNHGGDSWYSDAKHGEPPEGQQKQGKIFYVDGKIAWYHNPSLWSRCGVTSGGLGSMAATGPEVDFEAGQFGGPETSTMTESRNQQHPLGDHQLMTEAIWSDTAGDLLISVPSCDGYTAATSPQDRIEEEFEIGEEETIGGSTTWVDPYDRRDHSRRGSI